jgi:hypothetical protein
MSEKFWQFAAQSGQKSPHKATKCRFGGPSV